MAIRRRKPNPYFKRGTIFRFALDALREAVTVREITDAMLAAKGRPGCPPNVVRALFGAVQAALRMHNGDSVVEDKSTDPARWTLC